MIPENHALLKKQRTTFDQDNIDAYALRIRKYLRDGDHILDIGCGFGFVDLAIAKHVDATFTLVDKTGDEKPVSFSPRGYAHNDLEMTRRNVRSLDATVQDARSFSVTRPVDVVISTLSWGWHYPIGVYRDKVLALKPRVIILDLRMPDGFAEYAPIDQFTINRKENTVVFRRTG